MVTIYSGTIDDSFVKSPKARPCCQ